MRYQVLTFCKQLLTNNMALSNNKGPSNSHTINCKGTKGQLHQTNSSIILAEHITNVIEDQPLFLGWLHELPACDVRLQIESAIWW